MAEVQAQDDVTFHIKNPGRSNDNFQVTIPLNATVGELQQVISHQYDGQPDPSIQTPVDLSLPQNMHLVIRSFQQPSIGSVSGSVDAPTTSAAPSTGTASGSSTGPAASNAHSHAGTSSSNGYAAMDSRPASAAGPSNPAEGATVDPTAGLGASSSFSGASTSSAAESQVPMLPLMMQPYVVMNPVFAAAYSAAYTAALTAQMSLHAQQQQSGQPSLTMPPMALYYQYPAFGQFPQQPPFQGMPGARPFPGHLQAGVYGYPYPMHAPFQMQPYPQMYGMQPQQQQQGPRQRFFSVSFARAPPPGDAGQRRARPARVWTIRISMRMLLQLLVFGVVLYQHCTLQRFIVLTVIAVVLWLTRYWDPLRRFMASIAHPPPPHGAVPPPQEGQPAAAAPVRNSLLREIAVLVLGFLTSLLPAWNYNPDDAAAFAAAQQVVAQEEQEQRQQQNEEAGGQQEGQQPPPPPADHPHQE